MKRFGVALLPLVLLLGLALPNAGAQTPVFTESFEGDPAAPAPWVPLDWDIQRHARGEQAWAAPEPIHAQHGADCAGPPNAHLVETWADTLFLCRDHLMTALKASDYGVIYFTPPALLDFRSGPASVTWEMSTERMSVRDWIDVTISPWDDNVARPITGLGQGVDLQGPPMNAIRVANDNGQGAPALWASRNGVLTTLRNGEEAPPLASGILPGTNQAATRQTFRFTVSRTHATFERLSSNTAPALVYWSDPIADLGWDQGVVQFGHHSYNPEKDNSGIPGTWHWDNIRIAPFVPFTIIPSGVHLTQRDADAVTFPRPAPANAMLRFAATSGTDVEVSYDGGPFAPAQRSTQPVGDTYKAVSYWTPMPAGATSVRFRGTGGYWGNHWRVEDAHIWAQSGAEPNPTASPAPAPSPAPRPTPPALPSPRPVPTPAPPLVPSPVPSASPSPTPLPERECRTQEWRTDRWVTTVSYTTTEQC